MDKLKLCRTCLCESPNISVFDSLSDAESSHRSFSDVIMHISAITIFENDGLPQRICTSCEKQITSIIAFINLCKISNRKLQKWINNINNKNFVERRVEDMKEEPLDGAFTDDTSILPKHKSNQANKSSKGKGNRSLKKYLNFTCEVCSKSYKYQKNLDRHKCLKNENNGETTETENPTLPSSTGDNSKSIPSNKVHEPNYVTENKKVLVEKLEDQYWEDSLDILDNDFDQKTYSNDQNIEEVSGCLKNYLCEICYKTFKTKIDLENHIHDDSELTFTCNICNKKFEDVKCLGTHLNGHGVLNQRNYKCKFCSTYFKRQSELTVHVRKHTGERPYKCRFCEKNFIKSLNLKYHERIHTGEKPYACHMCDKRFITNVKLTTHIRIHTGEKPYGCSQCEKFFSQKNALKTHIKIMHDSPKTKKKKNSYDYVPKYPCEVCNKLFRFKANLQQHMLTHTKEKPFLCSSCGKGFVSQQSLKYHSLSHTGEKPHLCKICNAGFASQSGLKKHEDRHSGVKSYKCEICGKSYFQNGHLRTHIKTTHEGAKPYECTLCEKKFSTSYKLKRHKQMHTGEKPFPCNECGERFGRKEILQAHMRRHTGEKPFTCKICHQSYSHSGTLYTHMKTQHKKSEQLL